MENQVIVRGLMPPDETISPVVYVERDWGYEDDEQIYADMTHLFHVSIGKMFLDLLEKSYLLFSMQDYTEDGLCTSTVINIDNECQQFDGDVYAFDYRKHSKSYSKVIQDSVFISRLIEKLYNSEFTVSVHDQELLDVYHATMLCGQVNSYLGMEDMLRPEDISSCRAILNYNPALTLTKDGIEKSSNRNLMHCIRSILNVIPLLDFTNRDAIEIVVSGIVCKAFDGLFTLDIELTDEDKEEIIVKNGASLPLEWFNLPGYMEVAKCFREVIFSDDAMFEHLKQLKYEMVRYSGYMYCVDGMIGRDMRNTTEGYLHEHNNLRYAFFLKPLELKCVGLDFESDVVWSWVDVKNVYRFISLYNVSEGGILNFDNDEITMKVVKFLSHANIRCLVHIEVHGTVMFFTYIDL